MPDTDTDDDCYAIITARTGRVYLAFVSADDYHEYDAFPSLRKAKAWCCEQLHKAEVRWVKIERDGYWPAWHWNI